MRSFLIIAVIFCGLATLGVEAQGTETKAERKAKKAAEKARVKTEKKEAAAHRREITVSLLELLKFPQSFAQRGGQMRVRAGVGEVNQQRDRDTIAYLLSVTDGENSSNPYAILANEVSFLMSEDLARSYLTAKQNNLDLRYSSVVSADVYFSLESREASGQVYYLAPVSCVVLYSLRGQQAVLGNCPLVK